MATESGWAQRAAVIAKVTDALVGAAALHRHPLRVGLDGRSAAGKTTLAEELGAELRGRGNECVRVSIDAFHKPGHKWRSIRGEWTPELRLAEGLDYAAFRMMVLEPLGPAGVRRIRPRLFDSYNDEFYPEESLSVREGTILVSDAGYGFVPELRDLWDFRIWVEVRAEVMIERAIVRDSAWSPGADEIRHRYETFWAACDEFYQRLHRPAETAHCVIDNNNFARPSVTRLSV